MNDLSPLDTFKAFVLDPERKDAAKRLADRSYWGDTGKAVLTAVVYVEGAINRTPYDAFSDLPAWLEAVSLAMEQARERYREEEEDEDGYGSATFQACLRRVDGLKEYVRESAAGEPYRGESSAESK